MLRDGRRLGHPFLDISGSGLLAAASAACSRSPSRPTTRSSRRFYVYYTDRSGNIRVDEFKRRSATRAARGSRRAVIEIPHPVNANHNGGQLQFLGDLLYFGTGDGGSGGDPPNNAQNRHVLLGKLLRIDPRPSHGRPYSIPPDNPFAGGKGGRRRDLQLRPAQPLPLLLRRVSATQPRLAIGDVGQNRFEEVDYTTGRRRRRRQLRLGRPRGLRPLPRRKQRHARPGRHDQADLRLPAQPRRQLRDHRRLRRRRPPPPLPPRPLRLRRPLRGGAAQPRPPPAAAPAATASSASASRTPSSFGEDDRGRIYVCSLEGPVYRLVPVSGYSWLTSQLEGSGQVESGTAPKVE